MAILGTFWFRTQQRREELAVRLVAGATPHSLQTLLMGEGFLLITIAYIPALVVAYNLGISDLVETWPVEWSFTRFLIGGLVTFLLEHCISALIYISGNEIVCENEVGVHFRTVYNKDNMFIFSFLCLWHDFG